MGFKVMNMKRKYLEKLGFSLQIWDLKADINRKLEYPDFVLASKYGI